jgi:hypothetical protein
MIIRQDLKVYHRNGRIENFNDTVLNQLWSKVWGFVENPMLTLDRDFIDKFNMTFKKQKRTMIKQTGVYVFPQNSNFCECMILVNHLAKDNKKFYYCVSVNDIIISDIFEEVNEVFKFLNLENTRNFFRDIHNRQTKLLIAYFSNSTSSSSSNHSKLSEISDEEKIVETEQQIETDQQKSDQKEEIESVTKKDEDQGITETFDDITETFDDITEWSKNLFKRNIDDNSPKSNEKRIHQ